MFDAIIVGGGPAGLSAALMLGRCRRPVLVCDRGEPRNRYSRALHGYLTRDGIAPAEFNAIGREELSRYGIECRHVDVAGVLRVADGFEITLSDHRIERARFVLLATGVVDELPAIEGIGACYGRSVFHCPYCDGWEWRDRQLAATGTGASAARLALSLTTWSSRVLLCTNRQRIDARLAARLGRQGVTIDRRRIASLAHRDGLLERIIFADGDEIPCEALYFATAQRQQDPLAAELGCEFSTRGTVKTGPLSETNVPGVFVAGDASRDAQFVAVAAAEGLKAAVAINQALQRMERR